MCNDVPVAGQLLITVPAAQRHTPSLSFLAGTRFSFLEILGLNPAVWSQCGLPQAVSLDGCNTLAQSTVLELGCLPIAPAIQVYRQ